VAEKLDNDGIYVWDGNYYALAVTERLDEIARFAASLGRIARGK